jgi:hypothetical protein
MYVYIVAMEVAENGWRSLKIDFAKKEAFPMACWPSLFVSLTVGISYDLFAANLFFLHNHLLVAFLKFKINQK